MRVATGPAPMRLRSRRYRIWSASNPPGQGTPSARRPSGDGVYRTPRGREGASEELRPGEREVDALPHRRHRARKLGEPLKMPRRVHRGLPFVRDRPLESPRGTDPKRRELRRLRPRGPRLPLRMESEHPVPVIVRHRRAYHPQRLPLRRRDNRRGQCLEVA